MNFGVSGSAATGSVLPTPTTAAASLPPSLAPYVPEWLAENPYFSAGFGLVGVGACLAVARNTAVQASRLAKKLLLSTLEIPSTDVSYPWVSHWMIDRGYLKRHLGVRTSQVNSKDHEQSATFNFIPSTGRHYVNYRNRPIVVDRERAATMVDLNTGTPWETLKLTCFAWDQSSVLSLLEEARLAALSKEKGKTVIYTSFGQDWRPFGDPKHVRPFNSVVLADGVAETVLTDVKEFLSTRQWYFDCGIPYRRGYLLHGPPGCGKTSYVMAVAGALNYNICILNVGDPLLTDDRLNYLLATVPPRTLLLLEDIDGAIRLSEQVDSKPTHPAKTVVSNPYGVRSVTFSGLLNALDGVVATEERLTFMTTNHLQRLPDSLIRPGRIDLKVRIGFATESQLSRMFLRFFPNEKKRTQEFSTILKEMQITMAELQGFFMFCKDSAEAAVEMARKWRQSESAPDKQSGELPNSTRRQLDDKSANEKLDSIPLEERTETRLQDRQLESKLTSA